MLATPEWQMTESLLARRNLLKFQINLCSAQKKMLYRLKASVLPLITTLLRSLAELAANHISVCGYPDIALAWHCV
jgi:hypothetical protein